MPFLAYRVPVSGNRRVRSVRVQAGQADGQGDRPAAREGTIEMSMKGTWLASVRGYVWVRLIGGRAQSFLNLAVEQRIGLWNIAHTPDGELTFGVTVPDFFRLPPLLRACGCRTRILQKRGLPFQMARLAKRKTFAAGMLAFVALLFILSTFVWQVKIEGETEIPDQRILQAARQIGLYPLQWAPRLAEPQQLADKLAAKLPDAAWVGVERRGTTMFITVVDATKPDAKAGEGPRDLVAKADAVITRVAAENGRPLVKRHDRVRKGQVLVSGWLGDEMFGKAVVSKGTVMGLVWHEVKISSPLIRELKTLTGESKDRLYWVIGGRALQISGYGGESYEQSRTSATVFPWRIFSWRLPLGIMKEREMEVKTARAELTAAEAKEAGLAQARAELLAASGPDARLTSENILHEQLENGKVVMTVLFEVEQSIAASRPIVHSSIEQGE